uniref:Uncharacterized protein n=1 Tax=Caenorhabditis japonica TaxID=281687 RepID=A0A8R1ICI5_CAEJA
MRLPATILILAFFLPEVTTNMHDEKEKQKVLAQNSLLKMEISSESRAEFLAYMSQFCLTEMSTTEFLNKYITWENVEFMDAVKD